MPTIKTTDTQNDDSGSVSASPSPISSALDKYLTSRGLHIEPLPDLINALQQPLLTAKENPLSLGFTFPDNVDIGASATHGLTFGAGVTQNVKVNATPGAPLFPVDFFGSPVVVGNEEGWLSLALNGTVNLGLAGTTGDLKFGFTAGGGIAAEYFRRFPVTATSPTLGEALRDVLSGPILPADVAALDAMAPGDISTVSGNGSFHISGDMSVSATPNPLASPSLPLVKKAITLQAGTTLSVGASYQLSGAYQIRVRKLSQSVVELGYYRRKGTEWSVSVDVTASVGVSFGETELLAKLLAGLTGKPEADLVGLIKGGLTKAEIQQIQDQIKQSIDQSLQASLDLELSGSDANEAAFLYRIDTSALDAQSSSAVHAALDGNLSSLTALETNDDGHGGIAAGITMLRSVLANVKGRKSGLKINLLGLLNFSSVFELIQKGEVVFEPVTGDLTINETVSGTRIGVLTLPAAQNKLRRIKFDALLVTTAYRASGSVGAMPMTSSDVHFAFNQNTNEHTMSDYLDIVIGLGLIDVAAKRRLMSGFGRTGPSTCLLRVEFGDAACEAMFLNAAGAPRLQAEYEAIGRSAMQNLLLPGDQNDADKYRRDILADDDTWRSLKEAGQPAFGQVLPALANDAVRLNTVRGDYTEVMWWAESMTSTAAKLSAVRAFIGSADPVALAGDNTFNALRNDLQKHVAGVVANSGLRFGAPFGLVALYQAAFPRAVATGIVVSDALTKVFAPAAAAGGGE